MSPSAATTPTLVVVGRVNEGKTSIVSTLVESDAALVGAEPGTTTRAEPYEISAGGRALLRVVDTPGFQEPERCLAWLAARAPDSTRRLQAVQTFVDKFRGGAEFEDEWRLLEPVLAGGFVLYVVDAAHPFRTSYEAEMEILRWTGRPAIALLNRASEPRHVEAWRRALQQHFSAVRDFDAHAAGFDDRVGLLTLLAELDVRMRDTLRHAAELLQDERRQRQEAAARVIALAVLDMIGLRVDAKLAGETASDRERDALLARYRRELGEREVAARREVERLFRHDRLVRDEAAIDPAVLGDELFVGESWEFFGLNKLQVVAAGTVAGAAGGLVVDAATGGHSLGIGALLGAGFGATATGVLAFKEPRATIKLALLDVDVGQRSLAVGPTEHPNFPWVVLGRAIHHARLVQARPHGRRDRLAVGLTDSERPLAALGTDRRRQLSRIFAKALRRRIGAAEREAVAAAVRNLLDA